MAWGVDRGDAASGSGDPLNPDAPGSGSGVYSDHGQLTGLTDDDHPQYQLLAGRAGGQTIIGGTASGEDLTLQSTAHATRGDIVASDSLLVAAALATTGVITPAQITGNVDNYAPTGLSTATVLRLSSDASRNITGLTGGAAGRVVVLHNVGSNAIVLKDDTTSTAANRFALTADINMTADSVAVLQYDATSERWRAVSGGGGGGSALTLAVNQSAHGFVVGDVLYHNGTIYAKADADAASTAEVVGIVSVVAGTDDFTLHMGGAITTLSGLTAGTVYFLSGTAGAYTSTEPSTVGQISKPLMVAYSTTAAFFVNMRGSTVGNATSSFAVSQASGNGSTVAFSLPATPVSENNVFVTISGVAQHKDTFSVSGSTITFSTAPPTGTNNIEFCVVGSVSIGTPGDNTVSTAKIVDSAVTNAKIAAGALFTAATVQASTSGSSIDFTGIPSGTQQIVICFNGVSTNASDNVLLRLGSAGGFESTGYVGGTAASNGANTGGGTIHNTTGFPIIAAAAARLLYGRITITLMDSATFKWAISMSGYLYADGTGTNDWGLAGGGSKTLSAELTQIRLINSGTASFDAGSINILYR